MTRFGEKLTAAMEKGGFTQQSLGRLLGTGRNTVHRWTNNKSLPPPEYLLRLARALGVPVEFLIDDEIDSLPPAQSGDEAFVMSLVREMGFAEAKRRLLATGRITSPDLVSPAEELRRVLEAQEPPPRRRSQGA